jgi:hypothetical protein
MGLAWGWHGVAWHAAWGWHGAAWGCMGLLARGRVGPHGALPWAWAGGRSWDLGLAWAMGHGPWAMGRMGPGPRTGHGDKPTTETTGYRHRAPGPRAQGTGMRAPLRQGQPRQACCVRAARAAPGVRAQSGPAQAAGSTALGLGLGSGGHWWAAGPSTRPEAPGLRADEGRGCVTAASEGGAHPLSLLGPFPRSPTSWPPAGPFPFRVPPRAALRDRADAGAPDSLGGGATGPPPLAGDPRI